jgi:hypothetical protein
MFCTDHQRLLEEERWTWAAYKALRDSGKASEKERGAHYLVFSNKSSLLTRKKILIDAALTYNQ